MINFIWWCVTSIFSLNYCIRGLSGEDWRFFSIFDISFDWSLKTANFQIGRVRAIRYSDSYLFSIVAKHTLLSIIATLQFWIIWTFSGHRNTSLCSRVNRTIWSFLSRFQKWVLTLKSSWTFRWVASRFVFFGHNWHGIVNMFRLFLHFNFTFINAFH